MFSECEAIGQVLGIFVSPLFLQMFMSTPGWEYGQPVASGGRSSGEGLKDIYKQVGRHMGLALFLPMVGPNVPITINLVLIGGVLIGCRTSHPIVSMALYVNIKED